jgi:MscS family membrane protein
MITSLAMVACLLFMGSGLAAPVDRYPLEPPDTSSPRAAVEGFLSDMKQAHEIFKASMTAYYKEPGLYPSAELQEDVAQLGVKIRRASRYLDLSKVPPALLSETRIQAVILLKEILDRIEVLPPQSIPDAKTMEAEGLTQWRIPHTNLVIARVENGPQAGEYLFTPATVGRLKEYYARAKHLPYKPGAWKGVYELYLAYPDWTTVPLKVVDHLPAWAKSLVWDNAVWQWIFLGVVLLGILGLVITVHALARRLLNKSLLGMHYRRLLLPLIIIGAAFLLRISLEKVGITGDPYDLIVATLTAVFFATAGWAIIRTGVLIGEVIVASPPIPVQGLDAAFIRLTSRLLALSLAAIVLVWGAQRLGVPVIPLVAGLGVGGLALALAAQPTIENIIAGLTLYADRPVRVGEACRVGGKVGIVEEIGMRSARLRTLDDTLLTIPNAEFAKLQLENLSRRQKIWYHPRIRLCYKTTPDQIRYILVEVRKMLYAHPKVLPDPARIRFTEFGTYSLDLEIFAYVDVADYGEFLEIAEDLNLRIMTIVTEAGTELAIPAQVEYKVEKGPLDKGRIQHAEAKVKKWRAEQSLYLPKFPPEKIAELADSLDYPPIGSPAGGPSPREGSS